MDKQTLSQYGWIVVAVLVLTIMIAMATPFGTYIGNAVHSTANGLFETSDGALSIINDSIGNTIKFGVKYSCYIAENNTMCSFQFEKDGRVSMFENGTLIQELPEGTVGFENGFIVDGGTGDKIADIIMNGTAIQMGDILFLLEEDANLKFGEKYGYAFVEMDVVETLYFVFHEDGGYDTYAYDRLSSSKPAGTLRYEMPYIFNNESNEVFAIVMSGGKALSFGGYIILWEGADCWHSTLKHINSSEVYTGDVVCANCELFVRYGDYMTPNDNVYFTGVNKGAGLGSYDGHTGYYLDGKMPSSVNDGDVYVYGDYEYRYNMSYTMHYGWQYNETQNGWGVKVRDTSKEIYGNILTSINGVAVTSVSGVFMDCRNITSIPAIPSTVVNMDFAFYACEKITDFSDVVIPSGVKKLLLTFGATGISDLSKVNIPYGVESLNQTFDGCNNITDFTGLVIPSSVTSMFHTFAHCNGISSLETLNIPDSVTEMVCTFYYCENLTDASGLRLPANIKSLSHLFSSCSKLTKIMEIPDTVTDISQMLEYCGRMDGQIIVVPDSVVNAYKAFTFCYGLTIELPSHLNIDNMDINVDCTVIIR